MPTYAEHLRTARDNYAAALAEISTNPKPSYSVDGQNMSWTEYQAFIVEKLMLLNQALSVADGPWQVKSRGRA